MPENKKTDMINPVGLKTDYFNIEDNLIELQNSMDGSTSQYMKVESRKVWYLTNNPDAPMPETEFLGEKDGVVLFKATLRDKLGNILAVAHGADKIANYPAEDVADAYMKAETVAIGRCLANRGYGITLGDEGDSEPKPIDKANGNPIDVINKMTEADEDESKEENALPVVPKDFNELAEVDKAVAVLKTGFPIKVVIGNLDMKGEQLWKVASACKKTGESNNKLVSKLQWGLNKKLTGIVNNEYNLTFIEFAEFALALFNDKALYKKALTIIKKEVFDGEGAANENEAK